MTTALLGDVVPEPAAGSCDAIDTLPPHGALSETVASQLINFDG